MTTKKKQYGLIDCSLLHKLKKVREEITGIKMREHLISLTKEEQEEYIRNPLEIEVQDILIGKFAIGKTETQTEPHISFDVSPALQFEIETINICIILCFPTLCKTHTTKLDIKDIAENIEYSFEEIDQAIGTFPINHIEL